MPWRSASILTSTSPTPPFASCCDGVQDQPPCQPLAGDGAHGAGGRADPDRGPRTAASPEDRRSTQPDQGIKAEIVFEGRAFPVEEPRFIRRNGPRAFMDYTRLTQNGRYTGWMEARWQAPEHRRLYGHARPVVGRAPDRRPRSTGDRAAPVDAAILLDLVARPISTQGSFFFHTNDDGFGRSLESPFGLGASTAPTPATMDENRQACSVAIDWKSGTRHAQARRGHAGGRAPGGAREIVYEPDYEFFMLGLGYGHPANGVMARNTAGWPSSARISNWPRSMSHLPQHLHVQALCRVTYRGANDYEAVGTRRAGATGDRPARAVGIQPRCSTSPNEARA